MKIILMHPNVDVGYLPSFLHEEDPRPAREQFDQRYIHGGWRPTSGGTIRNFVMYYPGDPPLVPIAMITFRDEIILLYPGDFVAIVQPDGSFEVARMD